MEQIKVSIVIPAYNVESYISRAIESCMQQSYENIEIVVVDDGSSDDTYNVVAAYSQKDKRIKLVRQKNAGVSSARNKALDMCEGAYVLFLDSDDWFERDAVKRLIEKRNEIDSKTVLLSCGCYFAYIRENGIEKEQGNMDEYAEMAAEDVLLYVRGAKYALRSSCYKLFSLEIIRKNKLRFEEKIRHGEDGLFVFEYLKCVEGFVNIPDMLWVILDRPGSATTSPYNSSKLSAITAVEKMMSYQNSAALERELRMFLVQRTLSTLENALITSVAHKKDVAYMRQRLRKESCFYIGNQPRLKLKLIFLLLTYAPTCVVRELLMRRK